MSAGIGPARPLNKASWFAGWMLLGFIGAVAFHYVQAGRFSQGYPKSTFLFQPSQMFNDYLMIFNLIKGGSHPYDNHLAIAYGPFPMLLLQFFAKFASGWGMWAMALFFIVSSFLSVKFWTQKDAPALPLLLILTLLPYPTLFAVDRMNVEMLSFGFLALFGIAVGKGKWNLSGVLLGFGAGVKIYLLCFICILLAERKFRAAFYAMVSFAAVTALSYLLLAWIFNTGFMEMALSHMGKYALYAKPNSVPDVSVIQHNHSIFGALSAINLIFPFLNREAFSAVYSATSGIALLICLALATTLRLELWKRTALIASSVVLLPAVSFDYTLLNWLLPATMFLGAPSAGRIDYGYLALFLLPLIPLAYRYIQSDVSIAVVAYPMALISFLLILVVDESRRIRH